MAAPENGFLVGTEKFELMLKNVSKICMVLGCLLFVSVTLGASLAYRTDPVSVVIGYHLCFGIIAIGLAIHLAYNPNVKVGQLLRAIPLPRRPSLRPLKQLREKVRNNRGQFVVLGTCLVLLGIVQTGGAGFVLRYYGYHDVQCGARLALGVIYCLSGMALLSVTCLPRRWIVWVAAMLGTVSFVGATVLVSTYSNAIYPLKKEEQFFRFGQGMLGPFPFPNPITFALALAALAPQQIAVAVAAFVAAVTLDLSVDWHQEGDGPIRNHPGGLCGKLYGFSGVLVALLGVSLSLSLNFLYILWMFSDVGYFHNIIYINNGFVAISVLFGLVLVARSKLRSSLGLKTLVLVLAIATCALTALRLQGTAEVSFRSPLSRSSEEQVCMDSLLDVNAYYCGYSYETSQICVPASKVCDGYLDMLLSVNGTIIKVCPKRGGDSMLAVQDETTCIMDRFSGIVYFTLTGLSVILVMSFLVVCTLIKGVLTAYFRMAKRTVIFLSSFKCETDNEDGSKASLMDEQKDLS